VAVKALAPARSAAIREDADPCVHWQSAVDSLLIVLAAVRSFREGRTIIL
jgi:hypothetical protein